MLGFQLRQQLIEIVNVPGPFDLWQHDHVDLVASLGHDLGHVIQHPGRIEAVDPRPQPRLSEVKFVRHRDEPGARLFLLANRDGVLQIAQNDIHLFDGVLQLRPDLLVVRRNEVDHALDAHRQCAVGVGCPDREGCKMLGGRARNAHGVRNLVPVGD